VFGEERGEFVYMHVCMHAYVHNPIFQFLYQFNKFREAGMYVILSQITEIFYVFMSYIWQ
jgi:hypothetical protein